MKSVFVRAFNQILTNKDSIVRDMEAMIHLLTDTSKLDAQHLGLAEERDALHARMNGLIQQNARKAADQEAFYRQYYGLENRHLELEKEMQAAAEGIQSQMQRRSAMVIFLREIAQRDALLEGFDESLWFSTAIHMTVQFNGVVTVLFRNGMEIAIKP